MEEIKIRATIEAQTIGERILWCVYVDITLTNFLASLKYYIYIYIYTHTHTHTHTHIYTFT